MSFFADAAMMRTDFFESGQQIEFAENSTPDALKEDWRSQFARIREMPLVEITAQDPQSSEPEANYRR